MKKALIVGAGGIAPRHVSLLSLIDGVAIVGIVDIIKQNAENLAKGKYPVFTDTTEAIRVVKPDYVILLTPRTVREPIIKICVDNKIPIFIEKPPCDSISTGKRILDLLSSVELLHSIGFMHRYNPALNHVLEKIKGERLSLVSILIQAPLGLLDLWKTKPQIYRYKDSGAIVGEVGIHYIDVARYVTRSDVRNMNILGTNIFLERSVQVNTCDVAGWLLEMENNIIVTTGHTWGSPNWVATVQMITDQSDVTVELMAYESSRRKAWGTINGASYEYTTQPNEHALEEYLEEHRAFLQALNENSMAPIRSSFADAFKTFATAALLDQMLYGNTPECK